MARRGVTVRLVVMVALGGTVLGTAVARLMQPAGRVYTVAQVAAGLRHHPRAWVGRAVVVRGTLAMVMGHGGGTALSTWAAYCAPLLRCQIGVGEGVPLHMFLVERLPDTEAAYRDVVNALAYARATWPPTWAPLNLVVVATPLRQQQARALQRVADSLPSGMEQALARIPVIQQLVWPQPMIQGGTPRLYRIRLLAHTPHMVCDPICDDGVLLDNPY